MPLTRKLSPHRLRKRRSRVLLVAIVVILLASIHAVDARTGSATFQHLHYVPIVLAGIELLFRAADEALYTAKSAGRNQVCVKTVIPAELCDPRSYAS